MLNEEMVPVEERWLMLTGRASGRAVIAVRGGLPSAWPGTARCVFVSYAYADLPVGKSFEIVFPLDQPRAAVEAPCRIVGVTQQYATALEEVPHGWKTLCVLDFPDGVPALIEDLPESDGWEDGGQALGVCSRVTLQARLKTR